MSDSRIIELNRIADDFGSIAGRVNEASVTRKKHSIEIIGLIDKSLEIEGSLDIKLKKVASANILQRNQDSMVFNSCLILNSNIGRQMENMGRLKTAGAHDMAVIEKLTAMVLDMKMSVDQALDNLRGIIEYDNKIILLDSLISIRKKSQQESLSTLKELAQISLEDSERAIMGSSANLQRGRELAGRFKKAESMIKENDKKGLEGLIEDANRGWNTAREVNTSSRTQFEFTEKVKKFSGRFHEDSEIIRNLIKEKHDTFESCLQLITVVTVLLSVKFKKYPGIIKEMEKLASGDNSRGILEDMKILADLACGEIDEVTRLNIDMTESSHINNEVETKAVELTEKELMLIQTIRVEVDAMTEAAGYPVEGSGRNIENGQAMESMIGEILSCLKE